MDKKESDDNSKEFLKDLKPGSYAKVEIDEFLNYLLQDALKYLNEENKLIYNHFILNKQKNQIIDPSEEYLLKIEEQKKEMVILSIDIVDSTNISESLNLYDNAKLITIFSKAIGAIVYNFNGHILKYIGDGIIAFFSEPDKEGMHNSALYCAFAIKKYLLNYLNPLLKKYNFPEINFRIGLNSGEVMKTIVGYNKVKQHFDLIGETINLASKIQKIPINNTILLGQTTNNSLNNFWKEKLTEVNFKNYSLQKISNQKDFKVFKLDIN